MLEGFKKWICKQKGHNWETYQVAIGLGYSSEDIEQAGYCLRCKEDTHGQYEEQNKEEE